MMITTVALPAPIAAYFEADRQGPQAVALCFTPQAVVTDEGRQHHGHAAITAWKQAASRAFDYQVQPFEVVQEQGDWCVRSHVTGNFPGSPVDLRYRFRLDDGRVAALEITA